MRRVVLILAVLVAVTACKKSETATSTTTATTTTQSTATTATVAPVPQPTQTTATTAPVAHAGSVIASADGEIAGAHIEVTELKRASGGTVNLKFVLINNGSKGFQMWGYNLGDSTAGGNDYKSVGAVHLVDPVNKKKYFVVRDADRNCMCSTNVEDVAAGSRTNLWAKFPAPPPEVTKITVLVPHFQPMDDVPISQ